jgi:cytochrome c oxidase subunit 4
MAKIQTQKAADIAAVDVAKEMRVATVSWLVLICLTTLAVVASQLGLEKHCLILLVFGLTFCKGKLVVDIFMDLFSGPKLWRRLLTSYVIVVPMITGFLYFLS